VHYLKDEPFNGPIDEERTVASVLADLAGQYIPIQGMTLKTEAIRKLNKAIDVLEAEPENGYFAFEDEDFKVLQKVAVTLAENSRLARSAPHIEDVLKAAVTEKPEVPENVTDIARAAEA
jgi:hypothetical protein